MKRASHSPLATPAIDEIWRRAAATHRFHAVAHDRMRTRPATAGAGSRSARRTRSTATTRWRSWCSTSCVTRSPRAKRRCDSPTGGSTTSPSTSRASTPACACRRALADRFGLRAAMAPTTPYREYYAALPADPLRRRGRRRGRGRRARPRRARASTRRRGARRSSRRWRRRRPRSDGEGARARRIRSASRSGRRPRAAARAPGSTTAGAASRSRAAGRARPPTATARARRAATRRARTGNRSSTAAPAAPAAVRPIIRSPCRCAIR